MRLVLAACLFAGSAAAQEAVQPEATLDLQESRRAEGAAFMVAAANPLAALAGYDALAAGGTAVDAAVAVQFMLNLVEPQSSGIGGGAFALYWDAETQSLTSFDGRERGAPRSIRGSSPYEVRWSSAPGLRAPIAAIRGLRHGPALVRRADRRPDPRHARQFRSGGDRAGRPKPGG
jgi:hypothetical protein